MFPGTEDTWERRLGITPWEPQDVTICIAAICEGGNAVVTASDREFGIGFTSAELEDAKIIPLFPKANPGCWSVGIAGTVDHATEVLSMARRMEGELESREWYDIQNLMQRAYRKTRMSKIEGELLASRGWTLDKFMNDGAKLLPAATYASLDTRMSLYDLGASMIVAGFGSDGFPAVLTVANPGVATDHTKLGFWCVGSGSTLAQTAMFSRNYSWAHSVEHAAYLVYEAKRISKRAVGVGDKETDICVLTKKEAGRLHPTTLVHLKAIFEDLKPKDFTPGHATQLMALRAFQQIKESITSSVSSAGQSS